MVGSWITWNRIKDDPQINSLVSGINCVHDSFAMLENKDKAKEKNKSG